MELNGEISTGRVNVECKSESESECCDLKRTMATASFITLSPNTSE